MENYQNQDLGIQRVSLDRTSMYLEVGTATPSLMTYTFFDSLTLSWVNVEVGFGPPRWNHCACAVEAIPNWKMFVFGGSMGDLREEGCAGCLRE